MWENVDPEILIFDAEIGTIGSREGEEKKRTISRIEFRIPTAPSSSSRGRILEGPPFSLPQDDSPRREKARRRLSRRVLGANSIAGFIDLTVRRLPRGACGPRYNLMEKRSASSFARVIHVRPTVRLRFIDRVRAFSHCHRVTVAVMLVIGARGGSRGWGIRRDNNTRSRH